MTDIRAEVVATYARYKEYIGQMRTGQVPAHAPWHEERFQKLVADELRRLSVAAGAEQEFTTFKKHLREVIGPKD